MRPVTHLASVVLPLPDSPTRPKVSPRRRLSETSLTAVSFLRPSSEGAPHGVDVEHVALVRRP